MTTTTSETGSTEGKNPLSELTYVSGTDIGMKREENQDSHGVILTDHYHYYLVADGMGGVKGGATASRLAIETFEKTVRKAGGVGVKIVRDAVWEANYTVFKKGKQDPALTGMGTTFVGLGFEGDKLYTINVGDSRAYRIRERKIKQLTEDHTLVQELVNSGALDSKHAENHPVSHMLTRSLGPTESVEPDCRLIQDGPARGDRYLLCSDGLYNLVSDQEICEIVSTRTLDEAIEECIRLANERGGSDNITVTIVEVGQNYPKGVADFPEIDDTQTIELDAEEAIQLESELQNNREDDGDGETPVISSTISIENMAGAFKKNVLNQEGSAFDEDEELVVDEGDISSRISDSYRTKKIEVDAIMPPQQSSSSVPLKFVLGVGIPFVLVVALFAFSSGKNQSAKVVQNEQPKAIEQPKSTYVIKEEEAPQTQPETPSVAAGNQENNSDYSKESSREETHGMLERARYLQDKIQRLEVQSRALSSPLDASILSDHGSNDSDLEALEKEREAIRKQIDVATRRLAVWYGRRKRLDQSDPVSLATEVAVSSSAVKDAKEIFERTTWQYLKASEELRYDPTNPEKKDEVSRLTRDRKRYYQELLDSVRKAIDLEISESDKQIAELTLQRETLNEKLADLRRQKENTRIVLKGTPEEKAARQQQIQEELQLLRAELEVIRSHVNPSHLYKFDAPNPQKNTLQAMGEEQSTSPDEIQESVNEER